MQQDVLYDKILGTLATACIGDALGAPTEQRSIEEIHQTWKGRVESFMEPPSDAPFSQGRGRAQITDDSSQMLCLVDAYIEGQGSLTPELAATAILRWSENAEYCPRFAGPTTLAALKRLRDGADPNTAGRVGRLTSEGTTNGSAMRVAPAGLANPGDPEAAVCDALTTCLPTHGTNLAISGAACIAAAVSVATVPETHFLEVIRVARWGAAEGDRLGRKYGREVAGPSVERRLDLALEIAAKASDLDEAVAGIASTVGTGLHVSEAVPAAVGVFFAAGGDPFLAAVGGANAGDDTDTVACMAGSIAGAFRGFKAVPQDLYKQVVAANGLDLERRAAELTSVVSGRVDVS